MKLRLLAIALGLTACWLSAPAHASDYQECMNISALMGWQEVYFEHDLMPRISGYNGQWTVDSQNYSPVSPTGHLGDAAARLEPFSQYKYSPQYNFGALLVRSREAPHRVVQGAINLPLWSRYMQFRINDSDNTLGDNAGQIRICFAPQEGRARFPDVASQPAPAASASTSSVACSQARAALDAENSDLDAWQRELRGIERDLDRRREEIEETERYLSLGSGGDPYGITEQARRNREAMHAERVREYNNDVSEYRAEMRQYNRAVEAFNQRLAEVRSCQ